MNLLKEAYNFDLAMWRERDIRLTTIVSISVMFLGAVLLACLNLNTATILICISFGMVVMHVLFAIRFEKKSLDFTKSHTYKHYWIYRGLRCVLVLALIGLLRSL